MAVKSFIKGDVYVADWGFQAKDAAGKLTGIPQGARLIHVGQTPSDSKRYRFRRLVGDEQQTVDLLTETAYSSLKSAPA